MEVFFRYECCEWSDLFDFLSSGSLSPVTVFAQSTLNTVRATLTNMKILWKKRRIKAEKMKVEIFNTFHKSFFGKII